MRVTLLLLAMLSTTFLLAQEDFLRFYGAPYNGNADKGYRLERLGEDPFVLGTRQNPDNGFDNIGGYSFNPTTGEVVDSFISLRNFDVLMNGSWPTPDGGFIVTYSAFSEGRSDNGITRFDREFNEVWTRSGIAFASTYLNFTFDKDGTIIVLWANIGQLGSSTAAWRLDYETGAFIEQVNLTIGSDDVPYHLTPLPGNQGYLLGGTQSADGSDDRGYLRRVTDDFETVWVRYFDEVDAGRMLSVSGSTLRENGEIWATGFASRGLSSGRGLLRLSSDGTIISTQYLDARASQFEQVDWLEDGFFAERSVDRGSIYSLIDVSEGTATVRATYNSGFPQEERTYVGNGYLPELDRIVSVLETPRPVGDAQMTVVVTDAASTEEQTFRYGKVGDNHIEYANKLLPHPNGEDLLILSSGGRPGGIAPGAQLLTVDPADGSELSVVYPSDVPNSLNKQNAFIRADGLLQVNEVIDDDLATISLLDEDLVVTEQYEVPLNQQYQYPFNGLGLASGGFALIGERFNDIERRSDQTVLIYDADGELQSSTFTSSIVQQVTENENGDIITGGSSLNTNTFVNLAAITAFDPADGSIRWREDIQKADCRSNLAHDVQALPDGNLGVVIYSFNCGSGMPDVSIYYDTYTPAGELLSSTLLPEAADFAGIPRLSTVSEEGEIAVAWGESDAEGEADYRLRLFRLDATAGTILQDTIVTGLFDRVNVRDLRYLSGSRLAVLAFTPSDAKALSEDIMLLVTGEGAPVSTRYPRLEADVTVGPNPVADRMTVSIRNATDGKLALELFATDGRRVQRASVTTTGGAVTQTMGLENLPSGHYALRITGKDGAALTKNVIVTGR